MHATMTGSPRIGRRNEPKTDRSASGPNEYGGTKCTS